MFVKPSSKKVKVFDPATKLHLKEEGKEVPKSNYWLRRLRDGDIVEIKKEESKAIRKSNKNENMGDKK